ncbi:hypothetical protein V6N13_107726 [Hibiscus sabdariffa]|uniref:Uncharacterized protein n=1 Tax=Hibiscus sabdariffa TaxID=183260 RepID=A0ABR2SQV1_9ROSI
MLLGNLRDLVIRQHGRPTDPFATMLSHHYAKYRCVEMPADLNAVMFVCSLFNSKVGIGTGTGTGTGVGVENLVSIQRSDFNRGLQLYTLEWQIRSTASANSNTTSSRSQGEIPVASSHSKSLLS